MDPGERPADLIGLGRQRLDIGDHGGLQSGPNGQVHGPRISLKKMKC
jgi:hypothetical protein